jgi:hypothetical protein
MTCGIKTAMDQKKASREVEHDSFGQSPNGVDLNPCLPEVY